MITSIVTSVAVTETITTLTRTESLYAIAQSAYLTRTGAMKDDVYIRHYDRCGYRIPY